MPVDLVDTVAGCIDSGNRGPWASIFGDQIALVIRFERFDERLCRRIVTDGDEESGRGDLGNLAGFQVLDARAFDTGHRAFSAEHFLDGAVPDHIDLLVPEQTLLHDLLGA